MTAPDETPHPPGRGGERSLATLAVQLGRPEHPGAPVNPPIELSSIFLPDAGEPERPNYGRERNGTWEALEAAIGGLEGGTGVAFSAGLAAVGAVLAEVPLGGVVVAPSDAYNGTRQVLGDLDERGILSARLVDIADTGAVAAACDGASLLWIESPTNPLLRVAEVPALVEAAHARGVPVAVDNTFATPLGQRPLEVGADLVVHSVTKFLSGHSDVVLGACVARDPARAQRLVDRRTLAGTIPGPVEAWLALRGLRSFPARFLRSQQTAGLLAARLHDHPDVTRVHYPGLADDPSHDRARRLLDGFGAIVSLELRGGAPTADAFCAALQLAVHTTSLGGVETTIEHRSRQAGEEHLPPGLLRMSVGCEDPDDVWDDLARALDASAHQA